MSYHKCYSQTFRTTNYIITLSRVTEFAILCYESALLESTKFFNYLDKVHRFMIYSKSNHYALLYTYHI